MMETSPCKGCTERFTACSDRCPKDARGEYGYKAWKTRYNAQQKHLAENRNRWQTPWTADRERRERTYLKSGASFKQGGDQ